MLYMFKQLQSIHICVGASEIIGTWLFIQQLIQARWNNILGSFKVVHYWSLLGEHTGNWWIPWKGASNGEVFPSHNAIIHDWSYLFIHVIQGY